MKISSNLSPLAFFLFVLAAFVPAGHVLAQDEADFVPNELIVKYREGTPQDAIDAIHARHGIKEVRQARSRKFAVVQVPAGNSERAVARALSANPNVEYAEPNFIAHAHHIPNDPLYQPYQWHMDDDATKANPYGGSNGGGINVEPAWDISTGTGVIVAVIDTGVAYKDGQDSVPVGKGGKVKTVSFAQAPDLAATVFVPGYDFVNNDSEPFDDAGHGTHVTGTIAQSTNNGLGVAGVAYGCSIMPIKVLGADGSGTYAAIADGIIWAANNGAKVINLSLGGSFPSTTLESALAEAYGKGVTIVCSSGNDGASTVSYPAAYDAYCLAVGATGYDEAVTAYSNQGASLDLTAPGGDTSVDLNGDGYGDGVLQQTHDGSDFTTFSYWFYQGTSMAAPHVSGLAALVISAGVATTPDGVRAAMSVTAEDKGPLEWDPAYGWGIIDAHAAVTYESSEPINTSNNAPVADPGGPYYGDKNVAVTFSGAGSTDPDVDDSLTYAWDFGDGYKATGETPTHAYATAGTWTVTLIVNDGTVDSSPATTTATIAEVNDSPEQLSVGGITPNSISPAVSTPVTITGTGFQAGATVAFSNGSGPTPEASNVVVSDPNTITATVYAKDGGPPRARYWDVTVRNPNGTSATLEGGLAVTP